MNDSLNNSTETDNTPGSYKTRENMISLRFAGWCLFWAICLTASDYAITRELIPAAWHWPVALLPALLSLWLFYQYYVFYCSIDELTRKIQSDALAIGFGIGLFVLIVFMDLSNVGVAEPDVNDIVVVFALSYVIGQLMRTASFSR